MPLTSADNMSQCVMKVSIASLRSLPLCSTSNSNSEIKSNLRSIAEMRVVVEVVAEVEAPAEVLGSRESDTVSTCIRIVTVYFALFTINRIVIDNDNFKK